MHIYIESRNDIDDPVCREGIHRCREWICGHIGGRESGMNGENSIANSTHTHIHTHIYIHILYHVHNRWLVRSCFVTQGAKPGAL